MTLMMQETVNLNVYSQKRSSEAFGALVAGHADWVYSTALRMVRGNRAMAEDVTQAVFLLLAERPEKAQGRPLAGWLFSVTRYCALNAMRSEARRTKYERRAAAMASEVISEEA